MPLHSTPTVAELEAAIKVTHVVYEAIAAHGTAGIPSGHLYAATMNAFDNLGSYEACLGLLVNSGLVKRDGLLLIADKAGAK